MSAGESAVGRVQAKLAEIERRITDVEGLLKPLLRQHAQAYKYAKRVQGWTR